MRLVAHSFVVLSLLGVACTQKEAPVASPSGEQAGFAERYPARLKLYPEVFIGHTPTIHLGSKKPLQAACVWNLDTGAGFTGPLTIMDVDSKHYWQSDEVHTLYPGEEPRHA